jgi:hypothetical protein
MQTRIFSKDALLFEMSRMCLQSSLTENSMKCEYTQFLYPFQVSSNLSGLFGRDGTTAQYKISLLALKHSRQFFHAVEVGLLDSNVLHIKHCYVIGQRCTQHNNILQKVHPLRNKIIILFSKIVCVKYKGPIRAFLT